MGLDGAGRIVDQLIEAGQLAEILLRILRMVLGIVVRRHAVEVLAVELEAVEAVVGDELVDQRGLLAADVFVQRREEPAVPPFNLARQSVLAQDEGVRIFAEEFRAGIGGERRPPELGLEAVLVELVHHVFHVGVAIRETLRREVPVAFGNLETVVERGPLEAELLHLGKRADDLGDGELALVTPCTPGRFVGLGHAHGHLHAHLVQQLRIVAERAEAVAGIDADEAGVGVQRCARRQDGGLVEFLDDGDLGVVVAGLLVDRQADDLRRRLEVADDHAGIAAPQAHHRDASAVVDMVVGRVHPHEVALVESVVNRFDPVLAGARGLPLEGPEAGIRGAGLDLQVAQRPAVHGHRLTGSVTVGRAHEHGRRERVVE